MFGSTSFVRRLTSCLAATSLAVTATIATGGSASAGTLPEGGVVEALINFVASPDTSAGANDWSCLPSAEHPNPVILLPGSFFNIGANFVKTAPRLRNSGYCVYAMNYGFTSSSFHRIGGLAPIIGSAGGLEAFVVKVRQSTGAAKVDIVGHSQGASVAMWWIKKMGGASQTAHYVGWGPSSRGTTLDGLVTLGNALNLMGFVTGISNYANVSGATDQTVTSDYTKALFPNGSRDVPAGPAYTVIQTTQDRVVTPYTTQALTGDDVTNIVLQRKCPFDLAGHIGLFNDEPTMQLTLNALTDGPASFQPNCNPLKYGVLFA